MTSVEVVPASDPLVGWRYWQLRTDGVLRSVTHRRVLWPPGQALSAVCLIGGHPAPAPGCACGIHAAVDRPSLRQEGLCLAPGEDLVTGPVSLWGTVVADDHGLRAARGYPAGLLLVVPDGAPPPAGPALAQLSAYGVPVATVPAHQAVGEVAAAILGFQAMSR